MIGRSKIAHLFNRLYEGFPKKFLGDREDWKIQIYNQFGLLETPEQIEARVRDGRKKLLARYLAVLAAGVVIIFACWISTDRSELPAAIQRPAYGQPSVTLPVEAKVRWKDEEIQRQFDLKISPKSLSVKEQEKLLFQVAGQLPQLILGKNDSLDCVQHPLNLLSRHKETGVSLRWFSDSPNRISEEGTVDLLGLKEPETVHIKAELQLGQVKRDVFLTVKITVPEEKDEIRRELNQRAEDAVREALEEDNREGAQWVRLPTRLGDGVSLTFSRPGNNQMAPVIILCLGVCLSLFQCRYRGLEREGAQRRRVLKREFPELVSQLVLLLNAGLVVTAAFLEVADRSRMPEGEKGGLLFTELARIGERVQRSNASLAGELMEFAHASGVRELVRFAAIVGDNIDKGSSLAEKLEREGELLRDQQRKGAEEQCRIAETKLTLPLLILLLVLIMIAIAPVMMEM